MARNVGEQNEVFLKAFLLMMFTQKKPLLGAHKIGLIDSLKFSPDGKLPKWKKEYEALIRDRNYEKLKVIFIKAPTGSKADLEINGVKYSVKNSLGAKSALVNHTNRRGFLKVFNKLGIDIFPLDQIIEEYWIRRLSNKIREDINNQSTDSPFAVHKEYLRPIVEHFLFDGTPRGESNFPADKMLIFAQPDNPETYEILSKSQAVDEVWDDLTFSVRSKKGMPTKYNEKKDTDLTPWIRYTKKGGSPKGALHIRY
jgi:hypothetical protein